MYEPLAIHAFKSGQLKKKKKEAVSRLHSCTLCPRNCEVNRLANKKGICNTGRLAVVSAFKPHYGEEPPLVGLGGSGTIFFTNCNLHCVFCQNFDISHLGEGREISSYELADIMLTLQQKGCHNINFVTPTHLIPQILEALEIAIPKGLKLPLVYNSGGYDKVESLKLLEGIIDIWMPDFKFWDNEVAKTTCKAADYRQIACEAIREMHRQNGDLVITNGKACKGLMVRHLVLPENKAGTRQVMHFLATEISKNTYVNIMAQYYPCGQVREISWLQRRITQHEFESAVQIAIDEGLLRLEY